MKTIIQKYKLDEVASLNPKPTFLLEKEVAVSFVSMANVSAETGTVNVEEKSYLEVSKGYTPFMNGDILVAKITPCFENGKIARATLKHDLGFGSSEFHVIRPNPHKIEARYLLHFLRQPQVRLDGAKKMTGSAGQKRVPLHFFANLEIYLPPLEEQKRIVEILDRAEELRAKRRQAIALLDTLTQSIFFEMFGEVVKNDKQWKTERMENLMRIRRGGSPRPIEKYLGGDINWIKIGDGTKGSDIYIESCSDKITRDGLNKTVFLKKGSLIFANCGVSLGFARILKIEGCIHDGWLSFEDIAEDKLDKLFLLKALNSMTRHFRAIAPDGTQPNLNTSLMKNFLLILPPLSIQQDFARRVEAVEKLKASYRLALLEMDTLFSSLQYRAFRGEL